RIPVGANIEPGRPMNPRPWPPNGSQVRVCVFGTPGTRRRALRMLQPALEDLVREGLVRSLVLVGKGPQDSKAEDASLYEWAGKVAVEENFDLGEADVSEVLASCDLSLVSNEWEILHKSGVYAASIAYGLACVIPDCQAPPQRPVLLASEAVRGGVPEDWMRVRLAEQQRLSWPSIVSQWRTMT
ncbi:MAG: hypothetical protein LDL55_11740, partial [Armatimonadetes bacterium]|nr:hypothetical protein [Armatimonadota bacterium]